ncbi:MAG: dienelactone hydrolase family protein [Rhodospirillales bacterium]|nr:dienelactone hydrolase family protein [Rhodospirillales bacterium]
MNEMSKRQKADDFDQGLLDLFDGYVHGIIERREFLEKAAKYAVGGMTAGMLLDALSPNYAMANQVEEMDSRIKGENITYPSPNGHGTVKGYLVRPAGGGTRGGVVVVHENRGLNPYIADVARRVAVAGFTALAPDGLTPLGGYPGTDEEGREMQKTLDKGKLLNDFIAAHDHLAADGSSNGKIGVVGFCYGGGVANSMAVRLPGLAAAVPFYGSQPNTEDVKNINAALLIHNASLDSRILAGAAAYEEALTAHNKEFESHIYEGANHGFHNDTTPRYDAAHAALAWQRTVDFFKAKLA